MKKLIFLTILISSLFFSPSFSLADTGHNHESEIEEGRELVESKVSCDELNEEQLEAIGEYLMEQMHPGESHEMMDKMMGGEGSESLKQVHIQMAKRLYCNEDVDGMMGMMPMMNMMGGGGNSTMGNMMGNWGMMGSGWGWFGWIFMILFWLLIIVGIVVLIKWLISQGKSEHKIKSLPRSPRCEAGRQAGALDILKERYAKGEIKKKEFEEKKKDLK